MKGSNLITFPYDYGEGAWPSGWAVLQAVRALSSWSRPCPQHPALPWGGHPTFGCLSVTADKHTVHKLWGNLELKQTLDKGKMGWSILHPPWCFPVFSYFPKLLPTISIKMDRSFHTGKASPTVWQCTSVMLSLLINHAFYKTSSLFHGQAFWSPSATTFLLLCCLERQIWVLAMQRKFVSCCWSYSADFTPAPSSGFVFLQPWANTAAPMCWAFSYKMGTIHFFILLMLYEGFLCLTVDICCR